MNATAGYFEDIIEDISDLVQIPTIYDAATITEQMPYGEKVYRGYLWLKEKALKDGFEVIEYDGHALAIRMKDVCYDKRIDVVSHVDVVEPGDGWKDDPFSGIITDGYICGRGTADMKGTLILTYYALKHIKDNHISCNKELRIVIGCDEERTMGDMKYYISKAGEPEFAFTPDGKFPFSLGEKGALMWSVSGIMNTCILEFDGGVQCNVISPVAKVTLLDIHNELIYQRVITENHYDAILTKEKDKLNIIMHGKAAHASTPELGSNATVQLLELIYTVSRDPLAGLLFGCFSSSYGVGAGIDFDIEPMGKLTLNLGILNIKNNTITAYIDCRYPCGVTSDFLTKQIQKAVMPLTLTLSYDDKPTLADSESPYLKVLLDTYREISKESDVVPFISGGVTYSKAIKNCVAFGPMGKEDILVAHQANEKIAVSKVKALFDIYTEAMIRLANI